MRYDCVDDRVGDELHEISQPPEHFPVTTTANPDCLMFVTVISPPQVWHSLNRGLRHCSYTTALNPVSGSSSHTSEAETSEDLSHCPLQVLRTLIFELRKYCITVQYKKNRFGTNLILTSNDSKVHYLLDRIIKFTFPLDIWIKKLLHTPYRYNTFEGSHSDGVRLNVECRHFTAFTQFTQTERPFTAFRYCKQAKDSLYVCVKCLTAVNCLN